MSLAVDIRRIDRVGDRYLAFVDYRAGDQPTTPTHRFATAMIVVAITDLRDRLHRHKAARWLSTEGSWPGSYSWCCDVLGIEDRAGFRRRVLTSSTGAEIVGVANCGAHD